MDLLRLVLARQPMAKLREFPVLLRDIRFLSTRVAVVNVKKTFNPEQQYREVCTLEGELFPESKGVVEKKDLCNRAIFLLNTDVLNYFSEGEQNMDFWYALSTGNPEIQQIAFRWLDNDPYILSTCNDLESIPWTEGLREALKQKSDLIRKCFDHRVNMEQTVLLMGFLELAFPGFGWHWAYITGYCKYKLLSQGGSTLEKDVDIEKMFSIIPQEGFIYDSALLQRQWKAMVNNLVKSGYLFPVIENKNTGKEWMDILDSAVIYASEKLLSYIYQNRKVSSYAYTTVPSGLPTRSFVRKVEEILNNGDLVRSFPRHTVDRYRIIAGYKIKETVDSIIRSSVGNPDPKAKEIPKKFKYPYNLPSLQSLVIYDVKSMYPQGTIFHELFRLGKVRT